MVELVPAPVASPSARLRWLLRLVEAVLLLVALGWSLRLRVTNLDAYTGSFDEGIRSQQLLLMAAGYRPFRDIFSSQGPLLLDLLYPFYLVFGQTLSAVRSGVVACSLLALLGAWWTVRLGAGGGVAGAAEGRQIAGVVGGLVAVVVLAISPSFFEGSRLALAEIPTIAPALLALGGLLAYRQSVRRRWLVASAVCCALALLVKPMALHVGAPVAVLLLAGPAVARWRWRSVLLDVLLYGLIVAGLSVIVIVLLGPAQVWDNLGAYRTGAGSGAGANLTANARLTVNIMRAEQPGLFVLAAAGALLGLWRRPVFTLALLAWAGAVLGLFAVYGDLADKHIVYLTPPVALLAALGAGLGCAAVWWVVRAWSGAGASAGRRQRPPLAMWPLAAALIGIVGMLAYAVTVPTILRADQYVVREAPKVAAERRGRAVDAEIAEIIRTRTPPDGWVLTDNPNTAFDARRKVIPYLVDTSGTRVDAGSLTAALATEYVQKYQPSVIVTSPRRLGKLDAFVRQLPALGYRQERRYDIGWTVYVRAGE
jgi:4-amino-4-deoxy-L-arabinose transferase-like glycosyltransferase